ncbi:MAG: helix-turn-helix transcriptional regulator [Anaerolineaceae bacterium]
MLFEEVENIPLIQATEGCRCAGGQPKNFSRPCLLLLLGESPAHGYELMELMHSFGFEINDPAAIYKSLRQMEDDGYIHSTWDLPRRGPARRVYELTSDGRDVLASWAETLRKNRTILGHYLDRYGAVERRWSAGPGADEPVSGQKTSRGTQ